MPNPRLSRQRKRKSAALSGAELTFLTGELQPRTNMFELNQFLLGPPGFARRKYLVEQYPQLIQDPKKLEIMKKRDCSRLIANED